MHQSCARWWVGLEDSYVASSENLNVMSIIDEGMSFFINWCQDVRRSFPDVRLQDSNQKTFLAWQTWELMRVAYFGLKEEDQRKCSGNSIFAIQIYYRWKAVIYQTACAAYLAKCYVHGRWL